VAGGAAQMIAKPALAGSVELETWTKSAAQVRDWAATAQAGDTFVYARERHLSRGSQGAAAVRALAAAGAATHYQRSVGSGISEYVVYRLKPKRASIGRDPRPIAAQSTDGDMARMMRVLRRLAQAGQECPVNRELAKLSGVGNADRASYVLKKLVASGDITLEIVNKATGARIITIVATSDKTAVPA
jgi:hypothetical protein